MTSLTLVATDLDHTFLGADQRPSELNTHSVFAAAEHGAAASNRSSQRSGRPVAKTTAVPWSAAANMEWVLSSEGR